MRRSIRTYGLPFAILLSACLILTACQPELNWRRIEDDEGHFSVMLPGKPASASRQLQLAGQPCVMHMRGVTEQGLVFSVAWTRLSDPGQAGLVWQAMLHGMLANIGATVPAGTGPGTIIYATGKDQHGKPVAMHARFLIHDKFVYQLVVTGPPAQMQTEISNPFLQSFTSGQS